MILADLKIRNDDTWEHTGNIRRTQPFNSFDEIKPDMTNSFIDAYCFKPHFSFVFANQNIDYEKEFGWPSKIDTQDNEYITFPSWFHCDAVYMERIGRKEKPFSVPNLVSYNNYKIPYIAALDTDNPSKGLKNYFWVKDRWLVAKEAWKYLNSLVKMRKIGIKEFKKDTGEFIRWSSISFICIEEVV